MVNYPYDPDAPTEIIEVGIPPEEGEEPEPDEDEEEDDIQTDHDQL